MIEQGVLEELQVLSALLCAGSLYCLNLRIPLSALSNRTRQCIAK